MYHQKALTIIKRIFRTEVADWILFIFTLIISIEGYGQNIFNVYNASDRSGIGIISLSNEKYFNRSYALVIGVGNYKSAWSKLDAPVVDAKKVTNFLVKDVGFDYVVTLTNEAASKEKIRKFMETTIPSKIQENDRFLFYFSGHGTQRQLSNGQVRGYLPMYNSDREAWDTMISMSEIEQWRENLSQAKHILFVFDCCFSGLAGFVSKGYEPEIRKLLLKDFSKKAHECITAGTKDEQSFASLTRWGGSLFTAAFVEGAKGAADSRTGFYQDDGIITLSELLGFISRRIKDEAVKDNQINQSPQRSKFDTQADGQFYFLANSEKRNIEINWEKAIGSFEEKGIRETQPRQKGSAPTLQTPYSVPTQNTKWFKATVTKVIVQPDGSVVVFLEYVSNTREDYYIHLAGCDEDWQSKTYLVDNLGNIYQAIATSGIGYKCNYRNVPHPHDLALLSAGGTATFSIVFAKPREIERKGVTYSLASAQQVVSMSSIYDFINFNISLRDLDPNH